MIKYIKKEKNKLITKQKRIKQMEIRRMLLKQKMSLKILRIVTTIIKVALSVYLLLYHHFLDQDLFHYIYFSISSNTHSVKQIYIVFSDGRIEATYLFATNFIMTLIICDKFKYVAECIRRNWRISIMKRILIHHFYSDRSIIFILTISTVKNKNTSTHISIHIYKKINK